MKYLGKVFILGDSYSTFEGHIANECGAWYINGGHHETNVAKVEETWWWQLLEKVDGKILMNSSSSGTTICHTGYNGADCSSVSFIARFEKLITQEYFIANKPDTLFVFGGTNDSWADAPIGEVQYQQWEKKDLYSVLPAFCYLLNILKKTLPETKIYVILNTELKDAITEGFKKACEEMKVNYIALENISKDCGHPNILGMQDIAEQVLQSI